MREAGAISGHVFRVQGKRGSRWYAKYRLPDGRQVQKALGPAWSERGRPPEGAFTKRTAEHWLRDTLDQARRGTLPGMVRTGVTFSDAAQEWLRYVEQERGRKPSTLADYRSVVRAHLDPAFGHEPGEAVSTALLTISCHRSRGQSNVRLRPGLSPDPTPTAVTTASGHAFFARTISAATARKRNRTASLPLHTPPRG